MVPVKDITLVLLIAVFSLSACGPANNEDNGGSKGNGGSVSELDPRVEVVFSEALKKYEDNFKREFFWQTPVTLASEALRKSSTRQSAGLGGDYNAFMKWMRLQDDPLSNDLARISEKPFELLQVHSTDKLDLARIYFELGDEDKLRELFWPAPEDAEEPLEPSRETTGLNEWAIWTLYNARFYALPEHIEELSSLAERAEDMDQHIASAVKMRYSVELAREGADINDLAQYVRDVTGDPATAELTLGRVLRIAGRLNEADAVIASYIKAVKDDPVAWILRAEIYLDIGQPVKAREYAAKVFDLNGYLGKAWVILGVSRYYERRLEESITDFESCYEIDMFEPTLYPRWIRLLTDLGRTTEARDRADRAVLLFENNPEIRVASGLAYLHKDDLEGAFSDFKTASELAPTVPYAYVEMAKILLAEGKTDEAADNFNRAVELGKPLGEIEREWGSTLLSMEDYSSAKLHLLRASELIQDDAGILKDIGRCYEALGNIADAAEVYEKSARINTWDGEVAIWAALMYANIGDVDKSIVMLDHAAAARWIDTDYIVENFPIEVQKRPEFANILANMNPQFGR